MNFHQKPQVYSRDRHIASTCFHCLIPLSSLINPDAKLIVSLLASEGKIGVRSETNLTFRPKNCQRWRRILSRGQNSLGIAKYKSYSWAQKTLIIEVKVYSLVGVKYHYTAYHISVSLEELEFQLWPFSLSITSQTTCNITFWFLSLCEVDSRIFSYTTE